MAMNLPDMIGLMRYGYAGVWGITIEGAGYAASPIVERSYLNTDGNGYGVAGLVIEPSAKIGMIVDRTDKTGIGKGFDLTFKMNDTVEIRSGLFTMNIGSGILATALVEDYIPGVSTEFKVRSIDDAQALDGQVIYFGTSAMYVYWDGATNALLPDDQFSPPHIYRAGETVITTYPDQFIGRRVSLFLTLIDPFGYRYPDNPAQAPVWEGIISAEPERLDGEWQFTARALDRVLTDPLSGATSAKGRFVLADDYLVKFRPFDWFSIELIQLVYAGSTPTWLSWGRKEYQPYVNVVDVVTGAVPVNNATGYAYGSTLRAAFITAFAAQAWTGLPAGAAVGAMTWEAQPLERSESQNYKPMVKITGQTQTLVSGSNTNRQWIKVKTEAQYPNGPAYIMCTPEQTDAIRPGAHGVTELISSGASMDVRMLFTTAAQSAVPQLEVFIDDGDFDAIPDQGWVKVTPKEGDETVYQYARKIVQDGGSSLGANRCFLVFDEGKGPPYAQALVPGEEGDLDIEFVYQDSGKVQDCMRRMIESSGIVLAGGVGYGYGAYDTLAEGQGYAQYCDEKTFDRMFDGLFDSLSLEMTAEAEASFASIFGGLLTLSQRAIIMRTVITGADDLNYANQFGQTFCAVRVGHPDSIPGDAAVIDENAIAFQRDTGQSPIRPRQRRLAPTVISVDIQKAGKKVGGIVARDIARSRRGQAVKWNLKIPGVTGETIDTAVLAWSQILFRSARTEQVFEIDIRADIRKTEIGDIVSVNLKDPRLWQTSTGRPGYAGYGRIIGAQLNLRNYIKTIFVLVDGANTHKPLCPSMPVIAYEGATPGSPTAVYVPHIYLSALQGWDSGTWRMLPYIRGDIENPASYIESNAPVEQFSNAVKITVSAESTTDVDYHATVPAPIVVSTDAFETLGAASPEGFKPGGYWVDGGGTSVRGWQVRTAAPPTALTGPQGSAPNVDHSATGSGYYAYCETTPDTAGKTYILTYQSGPATLDADYRDKFLTCEFWRYMYGATMGTLALQRYNFGTGAWVDIWSLSGNQGMGWVQHKIPVSHARGSEYGYNGNLYLRFIYTRGAGNTGDAALDDIQIVAYEPKTYLTLPPAASCNAVQAAYLHNTDIDVNWS